ncbi:MAG: 50S ribosomal protein L31 [Planctomycetota bacterium]|nr:50S ribosomal protein L31 [Planctomycetota bacterium]
MKKDIHPAYQECEIRCTCGNVIQTRSTRKEIAIAVCGRCHPFYTGKQKYVDTAGRIEKFQKKFALSDAQGIESIAEKQKRAQREAAAKAKAQVIEMAVAALPKKRKRPAPGEGEEEEEALKPFDALAGSDRPRRGAPGRGRSAGKGKPKGKEGSTPRAKGESKAGGEAPEKE